MLRINKRLTIPARHAHVLLRETLMFALGWPEVYSDPGVGSFGLISTGADGQTNSATPTTFFAASGTFSVADIGRYLVLGGANAPVQNRGVHRIVSVPSATSVVVASGLYGSSFVTSLNSGWRVVDPTLNTGATQFVVQGISGTGTPAWQARFSMLLADTTTIHMEVGPFGGYSIGPGWTSPVTTATTIDCDSTGLWYMLVADEYIQLVTESVGGGLFQAAYIGTGTARRPDIDAHFAVVGAGAGLAMVNSIKSIASNNVAQVNYEGLRLADNATSNYFTALPNSPFDLRRDVLEVAVGTTAAGYEEMDRGTLRGLRWCSTSIPYRSFVDNGRSWLSLGNGLAVAWDGSLSP